MVHRWEIPTAEQTAQTAGALAYYRHSAQDRLWMLATYRCGRCIARYARTLGAFRASSPRGRAGGSSGRPDRH